MAIKEISSSLPNEKDSLHALVVDDVHLCEPSYIKPTIRENWGSSSIRISMNNMNNLDYIFKHY